VYPRCDDAEQTIDMTQALGMAPGLSGLIMFIGSTDTAILSSMTTYSPLPRLLQLDNPSSLFDILLMLLFGGFPPLANRKPE
jgi:hypothetical protein